MTETNHLLSDVEAAATHGQYRRSNSNSQGGTSHTIWDRGTHVEGDVGVLYLL